METKLKDLLIRLRAVDTRVLRDAKRFTALRDAVEQALLFADTAYFGSGLEQIYRQAQAYAYRGADTENRRARLAVSAARDLCIAVGEYLGQVKNDDQWFTRDMEKAMKDFQDFSVVEEEKLTPEEQFHRDMEEMGDAIPQQEESFADEEDAHLFDEAPEAEEPQQEEPKQEEPKQEEPKAEAPEAEDAKAEQPAPEMPQNTPLTTPIEDLLSDVPESLSSFIGQYQRAFSPVEPRELSAGGEALPQLKQALTELWDLLNDSDIGDASVQEQAKPLVKTLLESADRLANTLSSLPENHRSELERDALESAEDICRVLRDYQAEQQVYQDISAQNQETYRRLREPYNRMDPSSTEMKQAFFGGVMADEGFTSPEQLPNLKPYRLSRTAGVNACIAAMAITGKYKIEDLYDPDKLVEEKTAMGRELYAAAKAGDSQWLARTIHGVHKLYLEKFRQLEAQGMDFTNLDDPYMRENMPLLCSMAHTAFDLSQERNHNDDFKALVIAESEKEHPGHGKEFSEQQDRLINNLGGYFDILDKSSEAPYRLLCGIQPYTGLTFIGYTPASAVQQTLARDVMLKWVREQKAKTPDKTVVELADYMFTQVLSPNLSNNEISGPICESVSGSIAQQQIMGKLLLEGRLQKVLDIKPQTMTAEARPGEIHTLSPGVAVTLDEQAFQTMLRQEYAARKPLLEKIKAAPLPPLSQPVYVAAQLTAPVRQLYESLERLKDTDAAQLPAFAQLSQAIRSIPPLPKIPTAAEVAAQAQAFAAAGTLAQTLLPVGGSGDVRRRTALNAIMQTVGEEASRLTVRLRDMGGVQPESPADAMTRLETELKNADPRLLRSSPAFRAMRGAFELAQRLLREIGDAPTAQQQERQRSMLDTLSRLANDYYTQAVARDPKEFGSYGEARRDVSRRIRDFARAQAEAIGQALHSQPEKASAPAQNASEQVQNAPEQAPEAEEAPMQRPGAQAMADEYSVALHVCRGAGARIELLVPSEKSKDVPAARGKLMMMASLSPHFMVTHQKARLDALVGKAMAGKGNDPALRQKATINAYRRLGEENLKLWTDFAKNGTPMPEEFLQAAAAEGEVLRAGMSKPLDAAELRAPYVDNGVLFAIDLMTRAFTTLPRLNTDALVLGDMLKQGMASLRLADRQSQWSALAHDAVPERTNSMTEQELDIFRAAHGAVRMAELGTSALDIRRRAAQAAAEGKEVALSREDRTTLAMAQMCDSRMHSGYQSVRRAMNSKRPADRQAQELEDMPIPNARQTVVPEHLRQLGDDVGAQQLRQQAAALQAMDMVTTMPASELATATSDEQLGLGAALESQLAHDTAAAQRRALTPEVEALWQQLQPVDPESLQNDGKNAAFSGIRQALQAMRNNANANPAGPEIVMAQHHQIARQLLDAAAKYIDQKAVTGVSGLRGQDRINYAFTIRDFALRQLPRAQQLEFLNHRMNDRTMPQDSPRAKMMAQLDLLRSLSGDIRSAEKDAEDNRAQFVQQYEAVHGRLTDRMAAHADFRMGRGTPHSLCTLALLAQGYDAEAVFDPHNDLGGAKAEIGAELIRRAEAGDAQWLGQTIAQALQAASDYVEKLAKDGMDPFDLRSVQPHMKVLARVAQAGMDLTQELERGTDSVKSAVQEAAKRFGGDPVRGSQHIGDLSRRVTNLADLISVVSDALNKGYDTLTAAEPSSDVTQTKALLSALELNAVLKAGKELTGHYRNTLYLDALPPRVFSGMAIAIDETSQTELSEAVQARLDESPETSHLLAAGLLTGRLDDTLKIRIEALPLEQVKAMESVSWQVEPQANGDFTVRKVANEGQRLPRVRIKLDDSALKKLLVSSKSYEKRLMTDVLDQQVRENQAQGPRL